MSKISAIFSKPKMPTPDTSAMQAAEERARKQEAELDAEKRSRTANLRGRSRGRGLLLYSGTGEKGVSDTLG